MSSAIQPRPGILDIQPYVPGRTQALGNARPVKLSSNETPLGASPAARRAYVRAAGELHIYPEDGCAELNEAIARVHGLEPDRVFCGAGSNEIIHNIATAFLGPGDEGLYSRHGFTLYPIVATAAGATPVTAPETNDTTDVDALLAAVTPRTRVVFLANPNNPTGTYLPRDEIERLHSGLPENVLLVLDAAYAEYADAADYEAGVDLARRAPNVLMTRTFSKIYGLATLRLGWAYGPAELIGILNRIRDPFKVSGPAQAAALAALADRSHIAKAQAHNVKWRAWLTRRIEKLGLKVTPSMGNFVLVRFPASGKTAAAADEFLLRRGYILRQVGSYGLPDCLRLTVGRAGENRGVVAALQDFMAA